MPENNAKKDKRQIIFLDMPSAEKTLTENKDNLVDKKIVIVKSLDITKVKGVDEKNYRLTAVVSSGNKDRDGDYINPAGWHTKNYLNNPVLLWGHNHYEPAIGKCLSLTTTPEGEMIAEFEFDKDDANAVKIYKKYVKGILNTFSVGFLIKKLGTRITENDPNGYTFDEQELFEVSAVNVPSNTDSHVMRSIAKSLSSDCEVLNGEAECKCEGCGKEEPEEKEIDVKELASTVQALAKTVETVVQLLNKDNKSQHGNPDQATVNEEESKDKGHTLTITLTEEEAKQIKANAQIVDKSNELNLRIINAATKK